jgi:hypothetical protein
MNKSQKIPYKFSCNICNYYTNNVKDYNKHLDTAKHINRTKKDNLDHPKPKQYYCKKCNKMYNARNSLWYHQQKCVVNKDIQAIEYDNEPKYNDDNKMDKDELILQLLKQNSELLEIMKNGTNTYNNHSNNINSNNKTFNLQVFLNETCKDAMNINDFVDSIKLQLSDFERMGEVGYAQGISDIITSNLQALDITQRPVHCTDKKRETMYVKDQDQWMKEDENKSKIKKMIKRIENKNIQFIPQFQKKYPNYANPKSHESDKYHKTIIEVMGGAGGSEGKEGKIIRNISKVITIREKE